MSAFSKALAKSKLNQQRKRRTEAPSVTVGVSDNELNRLTNILQENIIGKTKRGSTPRRTIEIAFRNIDIDRSDAISFNEFKRAVDPYLQGVKERIIKALFEYFDVDGNEELTVNEFCGRLLKEDGFNNNNNNNSNSTQRKRLTESRQAKARGFRGATSRKVNRQAVDTLDMQNNAPFYRGDEPVHVDNKRSKKLSDSAKRRAEDKVHTLIEKIKRQIIERGGSTGIHGVSRILKIMDDSGDKRLSKEELKYGLKDFKVILSDDEVNMIFGYFDSDGDGSINFDEFLLGLTGPLNERRKKLVMQAFKLMDKTGDGQVTVEDLSGVYNVSLNPDVIAGKITEDEALRKFLDAFDSKEKDGIVTKQEFTDYYRNIGASIDSDDYFELMIRNAWHMSGGKGAYANTTCRRVLVTHEDGRQTVEEITDDLGIAPDDIKTMKANLRKRGIKAKALKTFGQAGNMKKKGIAGRKKGIDSNKVFGRPPVEKKGNFKGAANAPFANDDHEEVKVAKQANMRKSSSGRAASRVSKGRSSARSSSRRGGSILPGDDDISETASQVSTPRPVGPLPNVNEAHRLVQRLRREVILRGQGRSNMLASVDRLQYHVTALQVQVGKKILTTVCNRYGNRSRLRRRDFGFVLRAFTENGTKPMTEDEVTTLWRSCQGGDRELLTSLLFPPTGPGGRLILKQAKGRSDEDFQKLLQLQQQEENRPEVLQGPFDRGHFGDRMVEPIDQGSVPMRMRYRYSRTSVQPPTGWNPVDMSRSATTPDVDLELEWVYGSNGRVNNNLHFSARGELVYCIAAVVVIYDDVEKTQRHFIKHDDDITAIAVDPSGTVCATGQLGMNPRIIIWDIATMEVHSIIGSGYHHSGFFQRAVAAIAFLGDSSSYICGIGCDDHHALGVWKWRLSKSEQEGLELHGMATPGQPTPGRFLGESGCQNGAPPQIFGIVVPKRGASSRSGNRGTGRVMSFTTIGCNHTKFWTVDTGVNTRMKSPLGVKNSRYGKNNRMPRKTFCGAYMDGGTRLLSGGSNGVVYLWDTNGGMCLQSFDGHKGPCYALRVPMISGSTAMLISGGADGTAKKWALKRTSKGSKEFDCMLIANINISNEHANQRSAAQRAGPSHTDTIIAPGGGSAPAMFKSKTRGPSAPFQTQADANGSGKEKEGKEKEKLKPAGLDIPVGSSHAVRAFAIDPMSEKGFKIYGSTSRGDIWTLDFGAKGIMLANTRPKSAAAFGKPSRKRKGNGKNETTTGASAKVTSRSHYGPLYGLARSPTDSKEFATVGEDKQLLVWNADTSEQITAAVLPELGRSCHFSPDSKFIAVGLVNGAFCIYAYHKATSFRNATLQLVKTRHDCVETIDDLKFSPNGQFLAVASHDNFIDIYDTRDNFHHLSRCKGHTSYITHIDWSRDSQILQSNCGAYEIIYWDMPSGAPLRSTLDKVEADTDWYSWTCVLGFSVMGIWPEYSDGTDVNSVHKSADGKYVVTADDFGKVKVYNAPCVVQHAPSKAYDGHSSHVMNIRFLLGDNRVVSVGGWDAGVFQWKFVRTGLDSRRKETWKPLTKWKNC